LRMDSVVAGVRMDKSRVVKKSIGLALCEDMGA
jgi:hypothetical protein